jgi:hypothetical protein
VQQHYCGVMEHNSGIDIKKLEVSLEVSINYAAFFLQNLSKNSEDVKMAHRKLLDHMEEQPQ